MAFIIKALGSGVITASGTVNGYVVPSNRTALVTSVRLVNGNGALAVPTGNVQVKPSGAAARNVTKKQAILLSTLQLLDDPIPLGQGDTIVIEIPTPSTPFQLEYSIFGVERD